MYQNKLFKQWIWGLKNEVLRVARYNITGQIFVFLGKKIFKHEDTKKN